MQNVKVNLKDRSYEIKFAELTRLGECVRPLVRGENVLVVTDDNVEKFHLDSAKKSLEKCGFKVFEKVVAHGEKSKTPNNYLDVVHTLASNGFLRDDTVVALGGGVIGDMAGFAAATYMRGINLVQVPTSLLAMIDSSIGGKVGVDLPEGKNLLGAFYQPKLVFTDVNTLGTLPECEWKNGLGEGLKYAILCGGRLFDIMDGDVKNDLEEFVRLCAEYKAQIVEKDEKEGGLRRLLNLGHTLGHAIEKASGYSVSHGEAVKYGLKLILQASVKEGGEAKDIERAIALVEKYRADCPFDVKTLLPLVRNDKKAENASINAVLVKRIGECYVEKLSFEDFEKLF